MRAYDLIKKKRDGVELEREEIRCLLEGFSSGTLPDFQMAALLMAIYFRGLSARETAWWTEGMLASGERVDLSTIPGIKVDKHSTGGVGDTATLVLAPLVASVGVPVAKMAGRGLGHTGGTIDKLEAIPGFQTSLNRERFLCQVKEIGVAIAGQTEGLVPADKKLYAMRDLTATVDSLPLIASSVMSKKLASGADAILLDVKCGGGAFMKTEEEAFRLARVMVDLGKAAGRRTQAVVSRMDSPLGRRVGNALEVEEAILTLQGQGEPGLVEICLELGARLLLLAGAALSLETGKLLLRESLAGGQALAKFRQLIAAQGGDPGVVDNTLLLPQASCKLEVAAPETGYVASLEAELLGSVVMRLGAGRERQGEAIDPAVGVEICKMPGEFAHAGQTLSVIYARDRAGAEQAAVELVHAFRFSPETPPLRPLIVGAVE